MNRIFWFAFTFILPFWLSSQTILFPGDIVVLGLASNVGGEVGNCEAIENGQFQGRDRVSFVCFKDITPGTIIDFTDNGWQRAQNGFWGNTEGFIRVTRTGSLIPAGTTVTFEFPPTEEAYLALNPDGDWDFQVLGTNALNFNDNGDQLYILQGGIWNNGTTIGCCNGEQNATYAGGRILFAFNSKNTWTSLSNNSQNSALHPDLIPCFNMAPTAGITRFISYSGPIGTATPLEWISRIAHPDNWSAYPDCESYRDPPANISLAPSGLALDCSLCEVCTGAIDTLNFSLPAFGGPFMVEYANHQDTFLLNNISTGYQVEVTISDSTSYYLTRVTDANGCPVSSNFLSEANIFVPSPADPILTLDLGSEVSIQKGESVRIEGEANFFPSRVKWDPEKDLSDPGSLITLVSPKISTLYVVTAFAANGCSVMDSIRINVINESRKVFIPNAFSPNNDGINDEFTLFPGEEITEVRTLMIVNRWGQIIFKENASSMNTVPSWNGQLLGGKLAAAGVYIFLADIIDQSGKEETIKGSFTLVR